MARDAARRNRIARPGGGENHACHDGDQEEIAGEFGRLGRFGQKCGGRSARPGRQPCRKRRGGEERSAERAVTWQ
ncbi:MAG: hypothetical protein HC850_02165 [Rhodomicrobium sp.]|nr:hypothetical protein [Rhodomicrobium sp.]